MRRSRSPGNLAAEVRRRPHRGIIVTRAESREAGALRRVSLPAKPELRYRLVGLTSRQHGASRNAAALLERLRSGKPGA
jgi:hypothetical protein